MNQIDASLTDQVAGKPPIDTPPVGDVKPEIPGQPGSEQPKPSMMSAEQVTEIATRIGETIAEKLGTVKESRKEPAPDLLQKAIDELPEEHRTTANILKPILENIQKQAREGLISKDEAQAQAKQAAEDAINIQHLEVWKESMAKEWDGKEGKPLFDFKALDKFMQEKGYTDPEDAFYLMNREALTRIQAAKGQPKATVDKGGAPSPKAPDNQIPVNPNDAYQKTVEKATARLKEAGF